MEQLPPGSFSTTGAAIFSPFHLFTLSPFHPFTLSPFHLFTLSSFHSFTFSPFHSLTFSLFHLFTFSPFHLFTFSPFHPFIFSPFHFFTFSPLISSSPNSRSSSWVRVSKSGVAVSVRWGGAGAARVGSNTSCWCPCSVVWMCFSRT